MYNLKGKLVEKFGKPGEHLSSFDTLFTLTKFGTDYEAKRALLMQYKFLCPVYEDIWVDILNQLTFRLYRSGGKLNTESGFDYKNRYEWIDAINRKPNFIQVYDNKARNKLIVDIKINQNILSIINIENERMYALGNYEKILLADGGETNMTKIYVFEINLEE